MADRNLDNLLGIIPTVFAEERIDVLAESQHVRIERIVSTGHSSPLGFWYDQQEHEWVLVIKGHAKLRFDDGETVEMRPGDHILIPSRRKHRVEWTTPDEPTVWLAVFYAEGSEAG
jgi:cupin 2 domain-containing protein